MHKNEVNLLGTYPVTLKNGETVSLSEEGTVFFLEAVNNKQLYHAFIDQLNRQRETR
jgi:hypothetical protein